MARRSARQAAAEWRTPPRAQHGALLLGALLACSSACEAERTALEGAARETSQAPQPAPSAAASTSTAAAESAAAAAATTTPPSTSAAAPSASAAGSSASAAPGSAGGPPSQLLREPVRRDYTTSPMRFTVAFDGSQRFSLWLRTMERARALQRRHGARPRFTYFVNACYYTTERLESDIGRAQSRAEVLVRRALTQQAINEGHEIGNHGVGHHDGSQWSLEAWRQELTRFHSIMDGQLFEPIPSDDGGFVFPRFEPLAGAESGSAGARCQRDDDCSSHLCVGLGAQVSVCSEPCNLKRRCPEGMACGAPMFRKETDLCLPVPSYPVELDGRVLFDAKGNPNPKHPRLRRYAFRGHRAPYLGANDAMIEALLERGYAYDTSLGAGPGVPFRVGPEGGKALLGFALMPWPGARAIPMDYNYLKVENARERMRDDYRDGLVQAYTRGRWPWNVGHHFATWNDGAFLDELDDTIEFALSGCPEEGGTKRCAELVVTSFAELARELGAPRPGPAGTTPRGVSSAAPR